MLPDRPRISPSRTALDRALEVFSLAGLLALVVFTVVLLVMLPPVIPMHFDAQGTPDRFGSRWWLLFFPAVAFVLYILLTAVNRSPQSFNYIVKITPQNALPQYTLAMGLICMPRGTLMLLFIWIELEVALAAMGYTTRMGAAMIPVILALVLGPVVYYIVRTFRIG